MVKLGILMAHYKEPLEQLKNMLDSINKQNIDFTQIKVYILNDGDEIVFNSSDFEGYRYEIEYSVTERSGTSRMRNKLINKAKEKFIWFLDPDDELTDDALSLVLEQLEKTPDVDLIFGGALWEDKKGNYRLFYPDYSSYAILGCCIYRKEFLIETGIYADESVYLAGDVRLETLPKYYTYNRKRLTKPIIVYKYNSNSTTRNKKNNGWLKEVEIVEKNIIAKLLEDGKKQEAYNEYLKFIFTYNSKYIHDAYVDLFKALGKYHINYELDLR